MAKPLSTLAVALLLLLAATTLASAREDLTTWQPTPAGFAPQARTADAVTLQRGQAWGWLQAPRALANCELAATLTVDSPATQFEFFGVTWSAWPDPRFEDRGFEAAVLLRGSADGDRGYRVQFSTKHQEVALVRYPDGGYLRSVACPLRIQTPHRVRVAALGPVLRVWVDDRLLIEHVDHREPALVDGLVALGTSSNARITFSQVTLDPREPETPPAPQPHQPQFTVRRWLGERLFVFDDNEPILQLHCAKDPSLFAKLRPGYKPQLTFDSHWGLENQGAFPDAVCEWTDPETTGEGDLVRVRWSARHLKGRFVTRSSLLVGYDPRRNTYTYDVDSELEVLPGDPYQFKYGFDFEHHTPLDPFRWNYLLNRRRDGQMTYRPLSPLDPGPLADIETYQGLRVWHGRNGDAHEVSPAVEYRIRPEWHRLPSPTGDLAPLRLNTSVCAAFYDTGVAFDSATAKPGEKIQVQYRYTGYPAEETKRLFESAVVQPNPRIDPRHHHVFVRDQWPTIRFSEALPLDRPWWGGRPFLSGHNARPTYDWRQVEGESVLRLGPVSYALAPIGPTPIQPGRWRLTARVQSRNIQGPGGRVEILFLKKPDAVGNGFVRLDPGNLLGEQTRFFGVEDSDWKEVSFVFTVPPEAKGLALGLGNAGTGEVLLSQVSFEEWGDRPAPPETVLTRPPVSETPPQTLWDLRMQEGQGLFVYNHGSSPYRVAELANVDWETAGDRPALRFSENPRGRADFPRLGLLDQWLNNPAQRANYEKVSHGAYVLAGFHGAEALPTRGITLATWIRPAAEMGRGEHLGRGDILGYGARGFVLALQGQTAPYRLWGVVNVNDRLESTVELPADRWQHVAMTCEPLADRWRVRLHLDGRQVAEGTARSLPVDRLVPDSLVLGSEYFYLHTSYYRGLLGRTLVIGRACSPEELQTLARP